MQDTYDEKVRESNEDRDMSLVDDTAALLWGREM